MSHPTPTTRRALPAFAIAALFFAALIGFIALVGAAPIAATVVAVVIGAALMTAYFRAARTR